VTMYQVQPVRYNDSGEPVTKRMRITASVRLIDLRKGREILRENNVQAFGEFSELVAPVSSEIQTRERVSDMLAKRLAMKIASGWYTELMTGVERGKR
jgi:hypothetical protein